MFPLPSKHNAAPTTIFTIMSALAAEYSAINLSQGFPDFPIDERLGTLVHEAISNGHNQYAPMSGLLLLRLAIAKDFKIRYDVLLDPADEITITPGATYGIYTAFASILQQGDEVIVLEPAYDSYIPGIEMAGGKPVLVPLTTPDFTPDWDRIRSAITPRTRAMIINTPHNPTGAVWTTADWDELEKLVADTGIYIISDEVYEQIVFDGQKHQSILQREALRNHAFAVYSFGKAFHNTGWKMGYTVAPPQLTAVFRRIHQFLAFSVNTPMQHALSVYIGEEKISPVALLQPKRDLFIDLMKDTPFSIHAPAAGSYFQLASYTGLSKLGDKEFAVLLTKKNGVATVPMSAFYSNGLDNKLLRFCFAKKEETLRNAVDKLRSVEAF